MTTTPPGPVKPGTAAIDVDHLVIDGGPLSEEEARRLAELVRLELGRAVVGPWAPGPSTVTALRTEVTGHPGEPAAQLAARIARSVLEAVVQQAVR